MNRSVFAILSALLSTCPAFGQDASLEAILEMVKRDSACLMDQPSCPAAATRDIAGQALDLTTIEHKYDCRPLNVEDVLTWPEIDRTVLPVDCELELLIRSDGHADIQTVQCTDPRWDAHTKNAFEQVRWSTTEKGSPCSGTDRPLIYPVRYDLE